MSEPITVSPPRQRVIDDMSTRNLGRQSHRNYIASCNVSVAPRRRLITPLFSAHVCSSHNFLHLANPVC